MCGASSTRSDPSHPHMQHWIDVIGLAVDRHIPSGGPVLQGKQRYLRAQLAEVILSLEAKRSTQDCWFQLLTTLVGMCIGDAMMIYMRFKTRPNEPETKTWTFAPVIAKKRVENIWDDGEHEATLNATQAVMPPPPSRMSGNSDV